MKKDSLGDRIKRYEAVTRHVATQRMPLIIRVDGRAFHTFTRGMERPFDSQLIQAMINAAIEVAYDMQGFKAAYVQSDEVTFCLTDYDDLETQGWFNYNLSKIISVSAALMSVNFIKQLGTNDVPVFDSRAFNVPIDDVINTFLWRAKDWERNSLQMYARAFFSHKQLHKKKRADMHEMLYKIGKNWALDITPHERNGTFILAHEEGVEVRGDIEPRYDAIKSAIWPLVCGN
ncbi:MAG: tRNA(His) guanylyltransferase Thg1 family protein [Candidatus Peribacteraceae bacterium]|nr:tRNA(His) guanylyltransferase Thg1 family protein [Candidatus Peribacteraceae bacterium]